MEAREQSMTAGECNSMSVQAQHRGSLPGCSSTANTVLPCAGQTSGLARPLYFFANWMDGRPPPMAPGFCLAASCCASCGGTGALLSSKNFFRS